MTTPANNPATPDAGKGEEHKSTLDLLHETLSFVDARADQLAGEADHLRGQADQREHELQAQLEQTDDPLERQQLQSELDEVWRTQRLLQEPDELREPEHDQLDGQPEQRDGDGDGPAHHGPEDQAQGGDRQLQRRGDRGGEAADQERDHPAS